MRRQRPSDETLVTLREKLEGLPDRSADRQHLLQGCADLHGVSVATVYRALREQFRPRSLHRRDRGHPRRMPQQDMGRFCELVAAMKLRTTNQKGRHLSTGRALELLVEHGIETPDGLVRAPAGLLTRTTVNRYLRAWGLDDERMGRPPPAQRFQAEHVNDCWQFDLSLSDLKHVPAPLWVEAGRGAPTLMLFSVVDDRSGVAYQEYRCVYGEDVAAALHFLFNAMSPKDEPGLVLQGIPAMIYLDNGPVAKSGVLRRVMAQLGVEVRTHMPRGSDGRRVTARSNRGSLPYAPVGWSRFDVHCAGFRRVGFVRRIWRRRLCCTSRRGLCGPVLHHALEVARRPAVTDAGSAAVRVMENPGQAFADTLRPCWGSSGNGCARRSWCGPAGGSPARVRRSEPPGSECCRSDR